MIRPLVLTLAVVFAGAPAGGGEDRPGDLSESVDVRRARVPVVFEPRRGEDCRSPDPDWVTLQEDGATVEVVGLTGRGDGAAGDLLAAPTLHVLVLDTSPSMNRERDELRRAAREHLAGVPAGESIMVATLNNRLTLLHEPTLDREAAAASLDRLDTGPGTALWLALDELVAYLDAYPGRKVVALMTDGCDVLFPDGPAPGAVVDAAERSAEFTVFPVLVDAPARCPGIGRDPRMRMRSLARRTGGQTFETSSGRGVGTALEQIAGRLRREGWLVYVPPAQGDGSGAHRLELDTRRDAPCKVRLASSSIRVDRGEEAGPGAPALRLEPGRGRLVGSLAGPEGTPVPVEMPVPALDDLRRPGSLAALVVALAENGAASGAGDDDVRPPFLVDGGILLRNRTAFARGLYQHPEYRAWARERLVRRRLSLLDAGGSDPGAPERAAYRAWVTSEDWEPDTPELRSVLAGWLGDLFLDDFAALVDVTLARQRLVDPESTPLAERGWDRFRSWFEPFGDTAQIGLVLPGYGPGSDVVGFHRLVLPLGDFGPKDATRVPEAPLASRLVAWLATRVRIEPADVLGAGYHEVSRREARALKRALRDLGERVRFDRGDLRAVGLRLAPDGEEHDVLAWFRVRRSGDARQVEARPLAWTVPANTPVRRAFGALREVGGPVLLPPTAPEGESGDDDGGDRPGADDPRR